ncbi:ATP-NAD kinase-like domain-containing protein, partial [Dimargaris cristalligena]
LKWLGPPRTALIIKKPKDHGTNLALIEMARWIKDNHPQLNVVLERGVCESLAHELPGVYVIPEVEEYTRVVDFVITLGGDGTVLHLASLFPREMPPIVSFSMGTLGFLLPFHVDHFRPVLTRLLQGADITMLLRMRLVCSMHQADGTPIIPPTEESENEGGGGALAIPSDHPPHHVIMNEVHVHRGRFPHLTSIDCFVDQEFLTNAVADGLIVGTPTGSTAYSLSAGGPIVHPALDSLLLTPICPRSLSFRTILLPPYSVVQLKITAASRGTADVSLDGREVATLQVGQYLEVRASQYPVPCVNRVGHNVDWARDLNGLLKFNQNF